MSQSTPVLALHGSRLVRFLSELAVTDNPLSHANFAERLGRLINLSDTLGIVRAHAQTPNSAAPDEETICHKQLAQDILDVRASIVTYIARSFDLDADFIGLKLPAVDESLMTGGKEVFEPYRRFYVSLQRDMDFRINSLRATMRDELPNISGKFTKLSALDKAFEKALVMHARRLFAGVPTLLSKRFFQLLDQHKSMLSDLSTTDIPLQDAPELWVQPGAWLATFRNEMKGLLLAELDLRMQPLLGLLEAMNKEVNHVQQ